MSSKKACAIALTACIATATATASAQQSGGVALDQFEPAAAGDSFFVVPSPFARGEATPRGLLILDYAAQPLRLVSDTRAQGVVGRQAFLHVNLSLAIQSRLLVTADLPAALIQGGDSPSVGQTMVPSPGSAQIGDLRLGARIRMIGEDDGPIQAGVGFNLHLPTAPSGSFAGEGAVREAPYLALGGRLQLGVPFVWSASFGALVRSSPNPSMLTYGAGVAASLMNDHLQFGPEIYASTPLQDGTFRVAEGVRIPIEQATNAELLLDVRARFFGGLVVGAGAGPGLSKAIGTPALRFAGTIGWSPEPARTEEEEANGDTDRDGILDEADACPYAFGPKNADAKRNGCPVLDDDDDGIPNQDDACPNTYGPKSADRAKNGCPLPPPADVDGDGIPDPEDACPNEKGIPQEDKSRNGCPSAALEADTDGDGVPDVEDACPTDKGLKTTDPRTNGCRANIRVVGMEITLLSPIKFATVKGKPNQVDPSSEAALTEMRDVITQHPEMKKIEVQSYAAGGGIASLEQQATDQRAKAVRAWLLVHGISSARLDAKGYGSTKPIVAQPKTPEDKAKNERILFVVTEK